MYSFNHLKNNGLFYFEKYIVKPVTISIYHYSITKQHCNWNEDSPVVIDTTKNTRILTGQFMER